MRLSVLMVACWCALCLAGCRLRQTPTKGADVSPAPVGVPERSTPESKEPAGEPGNEAPPCDAQQFAYEGYEVKTTAYADLDGQGTHECLIGCQGTKTDDLGEPQEPAYFTVARYDGKQWAEWFGIPAPGDERYVDQESVVATEDLNEDGVVELALQYYGFGVSSRPETLYVWRVTGEGLEGAIRGDAVETSSDDGLLIQDVDRRWPGREIVFAIAQIGDEAHAAPHVYRIVVYGWADGLYRKVASSTPRQEYAGSEAALKAYVARRSR